jgi:hypothetical protein
VKYEQQRLYQQNGASAQHTRPHHEQGQLHSQSFSLLATSFEFGICVHPHFSCDEDVVDRVAVSPSAEIYRRINS